MSIKSTLAKAVPQSIVKKEIAKGSHRGDSWSTVISVIAATCETRRKADGTADYIYKGKVVGWERPNGQRWCDDSAYVQMRKEYDAMPKPELPDYDEDDEYDGDYEDDGECPTCNGDCVDCPIASENDADDDDSDPFENGADY